MARDYSIMPYAPLNSECREFGCRNGRTTRSPFCPEHGGGISEKAKLNSKLYNDQAWAKIRARQLSKQPLCARCANNGKVTAALHVDHVFPHRRDPSAFKINIFQSLCASCHTAKTLDENKGKYLHYTSHGVIEYTSDDYVRLFKNY